MLWLFHAFMIFHNKFVKPAINQEAHGS